MLLALIFACGGSTPVSIAGTGGVELAAAADADSRFGPVPDFQLTDQDGARFSNEDLRGSPFVVAAIFTTCAGPCPKISASMKRLQGELGGVDVKLVSISVDPEYDTPERLRSYGQRWGAEVGRWSFLTGDKRAVYDLVQNGLWLAAQEDPEAPKGFHVTHKTSIVAVDRDGERRGWYEGTEPTAIDQLIARMRFLSEE